MDRLLSIVAAFVLGAVVGVTFLSPTIDGERAVERVSALDSAVVVELDDEPALAARPDGARDEAPGDASETRREGEPEK